MKGPRFPASARCAKGPAGVANVQRVFPVAANDRIPLPPWLMRSRLRPRLLVGNDVAYHPPNPDYPPTEPQPARIPRKPYRLFDVRSRTPVSFVVCPLLPYLYC